MPIIGTMVLGAVFVSPTVAPEMADHFGGLGAVLLLGLAALLLLLALRLARRAPAQTRPSTRSRRQSEHWTTQRSLDRGPGSLLHTNRAYQKFH